MPNQAVDLTFSEAIGGEFPATWSQREFWWRITHHRPGGFYQIFWSIPLPEPWDPDAVLDLLRYLVVRHQALRTRMRVAEDGTVRQVIATEGTLRVRLEELPEPAAVDAVIARLSDECSVNEPELQRDFPLRIWVLTLGGRATRIVLACSHVVFDGESAEVLTEEVGRLVAAPSAERDKVLAPVVYGPADQAREEGQARGRRLSRRALAHWRSVLLESAPGLFAEREAGHAPLWIGSLTSPALGVAESVLVRRTGLSSNALYFSAVCCVLKAVTGTSRMTFRIPTGNRLTTAQQAFVGALSQHALVNVDLGSGTFDGFARLVGRSLMTAYANTRYDPDDLRQVIREVETLRGVPCDLTYLFNDLRPEEYKQRRDGQPGMPPPERPPEPPDTLASAVSWALMHCVNSEMKLHVRIRVSGEGDPVLDLGVDESCLSRRQTEHALLAMERLLVRAARGDVDLAEAGHVAGLLPE